jgi:hypothetical protein
MKLAAPDNINNGSVRLSAEPSEPEDTQLKGFESLDTLKGMDREIVRAFPIPPGGDDSLISVLQARRIAKSLMVDVSVAVKQSERRKMK